MAALWVGLDVGTSGVKAIAVDGNGAVVARGEANYPIQGAGAIAEQDPLDYVDATIAAIAQLGHGRHDHGPDRCICNIGCRA